jgi:hypothetical protein
MGKKKKSPDEIYLEDCIRAYPCARSSRFYVRICKLKNREESRCDASTTAAGEPDNLDRLHGTLEIASRICTILSPEPGGR